MKAVGTRDELGLYIEARIEAKRGRKKTPKVLDYPRLRFEHVFLLAQGLAEAEEKRPLTRSVLS